MAFGYDDEERAWVYTPAISIEKPSGFPKTFFSSEEAIDYLIQTDPNQKIEEE
jgi:hypothetical protein